MNNKTFNKFIYCSSISICLQNKYRVTNSNVLREYRRICLKEQGIIGSISNNNRRFIECYLCAKKGDLGFEMLTERPSMSSVYKKYIQLKKEIISG